MKQILLIGNLDDNLANIYKILRDNYIVQISEMEKKEVVGLIKIIDPNLVIVSMDNITDLNKDVIDYLKGLPVRIPVLFMGSLEDCPDYIGSSRDDLFKFIESPVTKNVLLKKCEDMLKISEGKDVVVEIQAVNRKKKILIIDDSGVFLRTIKSLLEPKYTTILAKSGEKGVEIALNENPDLILLDYEMPGWNGKETLEKLRMDEALKNIPVIFLTGVSDKNHIFEVLKLQPQGYLLKPVDSNELENKIEEVIGK